MPYSIRKTYKRRCFQLTNTTTKKKHSKCSSKKNVLKQRRLLSAIKYNKNFKPYTKTQRLALKNKTIKNK